MMNFIYSLLSERVVEALGWTFVHSLWQGALIALLLGIFMIATHKFTSTTRYFIAVISLIFMLSCSVFTFVRAYKHALPVKNESVIVQSAGVEEILNTGKNADPNTAVNPEKQGFNYYFRNYKKYFYQHFPLIVTLWILGMLVFALKFMGSMAYVQRMKNYRIIPVDEIWEKKFKKLCRELGVSKSVKIFQSSLAKVPMVIGYIKPVVLFPISAFSGLTPQQLESIIVHELAHVVRHDYLVNLLQSVVEILFFYHPAVWWMSSVIRNERENCCDDLAIAFTGDSVNFAKALAGIQEQLLKKEGLAMAVTGKKNKLLKRIQRLINQPNMKTNFVEGFTASCIIFIGIFVLMINVRANSGPENMHTLSLKNVSVTSVTSTLHSESDLHTFLKDSTVKTNPQTAKEKDKKMDSDRELELLKKEAKEQQNVADRQKEKAREEIKTQQAQKEAWEKQEVLSEEQERMIKESVEAQIERSQMNHENMDDLSDQITRGIEESLKNMDVNKIVNEAVNGAQAALREMDLNSIVREAMKGVHNGMSDADIDHIVNEALKGAQAALNEMNINEIVDEAMKGVNEGMKEVDMNKAVNDNKKQHYNNQEIFRGDESHLAIIRKGAGEWSKWRNENPGVKPDLRGAMLSDIKFSGTDLSRVNFAGANLKEANLEKSDLSNANLQGANLKEALLKGADLSGVNFAGANLKEVNLTGFDLKHLVFDGADMKEINLTGSDLKGASLKGTNLKEAVLDGVDFKHADMRGTDFSQAKWQGADFSGAFYNTTTLFPTDFNPEKEGMKMK